MQFTNFPLDMGNIVKTLILNVLYMLSFSRIFHAVFYISSIHPIQIFSIVRETKVFFTDTSK